MKKKRNVPCELPPEKDSPRGKKQETQQPIFLSIPFTRLITHGLFCFVCFNHCTFYSFISDFDINVRRALLSDPLNY